MFRFSRIAKALSVTLANRFERAEHFVHIALVGLAFVLALPAIFTAIEIDLSRFHADWKTIAGAIVVLIPIVLRVASTLYLRRVASAPLGQLTNAPLALPSDFQIERVTTPERIREVVAYLDDRYPANYLSALALSTRLEMYLRWHDSSPGFASVVLSSRLGEIVGCCVLLPITSETFSAYRNALGAPDSWTAAHLDHSGDPKVLFMPSLHFTKTVDDKLAPNILAELFVSSVAARVKDLKSLVVVAPIRSDAERANAQTLGFEMFRHSKAGFELWELDGRRVNELSVSGRKTFEVLKARLAPAA